MIGTGTVVVVFVVFAAMWGLQLWSAATQSQRFMREVADLRRAGTTAIGVSGRSRLKPRSYVALSADADGRVVRAVELSGVTVLARPRPVADLQGCDIASLAADEDGDRRARAAAMAARTLIEASPGEAAP